MQRWTVTVPDDTADEVMAQLDWGDSRSEWVADAIRRKLDAERDADESADEPAPEPADDVDALISQWEPADEVHTAHARAALRDAVAWLDAHGEPASKSEIVAGARGDAPLSKRSWWERAVQPGLRWLSEKRVVEYRSGHHDYAVCR